MQHACFAFFGSTTPLVLYFLYLKNACNMIYKGVWRLQASAADCVGQPYHLPSALIVTLLRELAQLENEHLPERRLDGLVSRRTAGINGIWSVGVVEGGGVLCACVGGRRRSSRSEPPSSASLFGEDFVRAGRRSMNASAEVSSLPPPTLSSGETGTTSFRKKEKKKFLEFQAPWNDFVRQELSSEALRFRQRSRMCAVALWRFMMKRSCGFAEVRCVPSLPQRVFLDLARL